MPIDEGVNVDLQFLILEVKKQARASLSVIEPAALELSLEGFGVDRRVVDRGHDPAIVLRFAGVAGSQQAQTSQRRSHGGSTPLMRASTWSRRFS